MQLVFPDEVQRIDHNGRLLIRHGAGLGEDREFPGDNTGGRERPRVKLRLTNADDIPGAIQIHLDMRRTRVVLDPAVGIVTEHAHQLRGHVQIRETRGILVMILAAGILELVI